MTHYQTVNTCNVEFLKSSEGMGTRIIKLNYSEQAVPPQLLGRIDNNAWAAFMREVHVLAARHPYVIPPSTKQMGRWAACFGFGSVVGCFCINPDGGSYPQWYGEVNSMLELWRPLFTSANCTISLKTERCCYIQIDIIGPPPPMPLSLSQGKSIQSFGNSQQGAKEGYEAPMQSNTQPHPQTYSQPYPQ